ncbi:MAG: succinyldiaminopimelate transaminase [Methylococcaceae bacterium]|nr:succinyldiaminopimelate transaminase [Methylococcaceae bacterium]MCI0732289.1 succinyldiaminopimelate transaminase [Methylococcaceae bacterium]
MNPGIANLHPYPFEKLRRLKEGLKPEADRYPIALSVGEPQHAVPDMIRNAIISNIQGLMKYPTSSGIPELREAISVWLASRFELKAGSVDPERQVLPVAGTREALFSFAQALIDRAENPIVLMPNPFYQIYEGAALLAGAEPRYLNTLPQNRFVPDFTSVPEAIWRRCRLIYICSPGNPSGSVMRIDELQQLIDLADRFDFVIASDECYSEIYRDEDDPPPGLLQAARAMNHDSFRNCVVFHSLSKRSNAPGLRSGFVAGDARIIAQFAKYRSYHGCTLPLPTQLASIAAWSDENHVRENRRIYRSKFDAVCSVLAEVWPMETPGASFYLWPETPIPDTDFTRGLFTRQNVTVLPGRFLSRPADGIDPGENRVRIALVQPLDECIEAANRIKNYLSTL